MSDVVTERAIDRSKMEVSDEIAIHISDMNKWFGNFHVLRDINLEVRRGERIVVCGPSGSGKSTLIRCINRLEEHQKGTIIVDGTELTENTKNIEAIRAEVGMVFQQFNLFPHLSIVDNCTLAPIWVKKMPKKEAEELALRHLERVQILDQAQKFPGQLSGGQQQRVGIARSLASDPAIWFLDEPFSALDPLIRADLQDELLRLQEQLHKTTVFIPHDLDESIKIADRIAIMDQGRIVQIGSPEDLVLNPANDYVARFVKNVPRSKVVRVSNIMRNATSADSVGDWVVNANDRLAEVAPRIGESTQSIAIQDDDGVTLGYVDRDKFLRVLAGVS